MKKALTIAALIAALASNLMGAEKTVKVFILAGQSNMVGHGKTEMGRNPKYDKEDKSTHREVQNGIGSLRWFVERNEVRFGAKGTMPLMDSEGKWLVRDDVFVHFTYEGGEKKGQLGPSFGKGSWFGPEFGFGHVVGDHLEDPVLIIKTSWGGHSLGQNFRPPSSGPFEFPKHVVENWRKNAGKHGVPKDIDKHIADAATTAGQSYRDMMTIVKDFLAEKDTYFPELKGHKPQIIGFGWHQGWNDGCNDALTAEYEKNMTNFIKDVRKELGVPNLPFVIANTGQNGRSEKANQGRFGTLCEIQMGMGDPEKHPEFAGTVTSVETRDFKRPTEQSPSHFGYHWNHNGETHFLIGQAMGEAMVTLLKK